MRCLICKLHCIFHKELTLPVFAFKSTESKNKIAKASSIKVLKKYAPDTKEKEVIKKIKVLHGK